ncbi:MAG: PIG-L family deacetylase [Micromonosporaceae bacterium]|jgi:4-oxalomesaconate hydratase|nr:PIG-L family deacetylase [Micromonosporaceae bacterium]
MARADASLLIVSAHAADFVWRAGGAAALYATAGARVTVACLSYGERGESARLWRAGHTLEEIKQIRRSEAEQAAAILGADLRTFDAGDYPLVETPELVDRLVDLYRETQPTFVLTHTASDPYNCDHPTAFQLAMKARILAQAAGVKPGSEVIGAPPVFCFEPHQTEVSGFRPDLLLDITEVWDRKVEAMHAMRGQEHLWQYYTDVGARRGVQMQRNSSANLGHKTSAKAEAYQRVFPTVATEFA